MTKPELIKGYGCRECGKGIEPNTEMFKSWVEFKNHENGSGDVCPGGEP